MALPISVHRIKGPKSKKANVRLEVSFSFSFLQHSPKLPLVSGFSLQKSPGIMRGPQDSGSILVPTSLWALEGRGDLQDPHTVSAA